MSGERSARKRFGLPRWTSSLTWKALAFITVMCCGLAALLGALVHVSVTNRTVSELDAIDAQLAPALAALRAHQQEEADEVHDSSVATSGNDVVTDGGRVLCVVGTGNTVLAARDAAYEGVRKIGWDGAFFRSDIGHRALAREQSR